jgi:phenylalanyl-tRNA synthetase beta chain
MGMKAVHSWLADHVDLPEEPEVISHLLSDLGLAVESVEHVGASVPGVVTARVLRTERHPDAAKVHRVFVDAGDGVERHVWCGAFNMQPGDVVPLALPGTKMPDGRAIEPKPILGIPSDGMLCSARELDLGVDHSGILIMDAGIPLGIPYSEALGLKEEIVYDLDVLRNRPEAFGHVGIARDLAARLKTVVKSSTSSIAEVVPALGPTVRASVDIDAPERCPRFTTVVLSGIAITDSPSWMTSRLAAAGMRPINNVVDASNYVMLELNQPNHPYDFDTLGGGGFRVRVGKPNEALITLDDVERIVDEETLLICDAADRPIGLAGIMGGQNTEISASTTRVALETAWFEPMGIMRSVQKFGLRTEASARFERGVDPRGIEAGIARFVELLQLTCPSLVVHQGLCDETTEHVPEPTVIEVRPQRVGSLLGRPFNSEDIATLIAPIGFAVEVDRVDSASMRVTVPSWRPDCTLEIDIVEEVARLYGYDRLGKTIPKSTMPGSLNAVQQRRRRLRDILHGFGANEAMPHPFLANGDLTRVGLSEDAVRIVNPLAVGDDVLRTSLRPGLLRAIAFNESHRRTDLTFYEIGHVYPPSDDVLPAEYESLAVIMGGADATRAVRLWREVSAGMGWGARLDQSNVPAGLHPTRSASLSIGKTVIGSVGEIHPGVLEDLGIPERCAVLELDLTTLLVMEPKIPQWKPTSRYPSADFDLAFIVPNDVPAEKVDKALRQSAGAFLNSVELFDVYRAPELGDSRGLAYRIRIQAPDRTLTDSDIGGIRIKCIDAVAKMGARLRD